jgi:hypothetical protein
VKLGKPHLIASLALLGGSVLYNAWVFSQPAKTSAGSRTVAPVQPLPDRPDRAGGGAAVDLTRLGAPPAVALDEIPTWPRDPFTSTRSTPAVAPVVVAEQAPPPESDLVVGSILHSPERRLAIVNGHIVRVGDTIGTTRIVDILPRAIVVESPTRGRQTIELRTLDASVKEARK